MSFGQILVVVSILLLFAICIAGVGLARRARRNVPLQTHAAHAPRSGLDQAKIVESKGAGMADGGR
ncbi:hypothetical protein RA28_11540 [Ruegeria sp. ANG-S4]|nr:hypothetical protein RA28_11540 [Ruegeria sp. ANG-S4]